MFTHLVNILTKLRQVREFIMVSAPGTLRSAADALAMLQDAARRTADYIESYGGGVAIPAGASGATGIESAEFQQALAELQQLHSQVEQDMKDVEARAAQQPSPQAGVLDWLNRFNPNLQGVILNLISDLLKRVIAKSGVGAQPAQAARPKGQTGA